MKLSLKTISRLIAVPMAILCLQTAVAQPIMIPGFMGIENSSLDASSGSDTANAYFTITNLHREPIVLLSTTGDVFESASFIGADNQELEQVVIEPGDRLIMGANGIHVRLSGVDAAVAEEYTQPITLLVRRGLEAEEEVEASEENFGVMSGMRLREAGIPNEKEYVVNVPVMN